MDVSRIEAISPKQIEWRKLTAPEIIEYKEQGIDVPSQYLQWAQSFLNDVNASDTDETTYEAANSQTVAETTETSEATTNSSVSESGESVSVQDDTKTAAQKKRDGMEANGADLCDIAEIFIKDSANSGSSAFRSAITMTIAAYKSEDEIQALENHMSALLKHAESIQNELKNEVDSVNAGGNDKTTIGKINKLNAQLEKMGIQAQANLVGVEGALKSNESIINSQSPILINAKDVGTETINIGNELLTDALDEKNNSPFTPFLLGIIAKGLGSYSVFNSEKSSKVQEFGLEKIADERASVQEYKTEVENKTGVEGYSLASDEDNTSAEDDKSSNDPAKNPEAQTKDAASANLEQILRAKIRRGENVGNDQLA